MLAGVDGGVVVDPAVFDAGGTVELDLAAVDVGGTVELDPVVFAVVAV